jgi:23S rRNA pseudouridine1911/1915/1917 synthase
MRGDSGSITRPIARDPHRRTRMTARLRTGRHARTDWRVIARLDRGTLVEAVLHTGRTHQIRAHFAAIGHPLAGDELYGGPVIRALGRHALHAARVAYAGGDGVDAFDASAPLPKDMAALLEAAASDEGEADGDGDVVAG